MASEVSINSEGRTVPFSLNTYPYKRGFLVSNGVTFSQEVQYGSRRSHEKVTRKTPLVETKSSLNKLEVRSLRQANACRGTLTTHSDTYTIALQGR